MTRDSPSRAVSHTSLCLSASRLNSAAGSALLHSSRELNETAYLLGYEDANSFFRAFHHWEGSSPGQWRLLQKKSQPTTQSHVGAA